ncbi:MAG: hypothetical protein ACYSWO_12385 [Planctomycetota bacterium]|jgi:hypothetical protein
MRKTLIKIVSKLFSFLGGVIVTFVAVIAIFVISLSFRVADRAEDIVKRLSSPDRQWAAFLMSDNHGSERNIHVAVLPYEFHYRTIKFSDFVNNERRHLFHGAFDPDVTVNLHENIEWSADSSLLVLTVDVDYKPGPYRWAYDFNARKEVTDPNLIESLWYERNQANTKNKT